MNANITDILNNGSTFHVVVEDGLTIITELEDPLFTALMEAMEESFDA